MVSCIQCKQLKVITSQCGVSWYEHMIDLQLPIGCIGRSMSPPRQTSENASNTSKSLLTQCFRTMSSIGSECFDLSKNILLHIKVQVSARPLALATADGYCCAHWWVLCCLAHAAVAVLQNMTYQAQLEA